MNEKKIALLLKPMTKTSQLNGKSREDVFGGALAREARRAAPWVKKCGKLPIRENLVIT